MMTETTDTIETTASVTFDTSSNVESFLPFLTGNTFCPSVFFCQKCGIVDYYIFFSILQIALLLHRSNSPT